MLRLTRTNVTVRSLLLWTSTALPLAGQEATATAMVQLRAPEPALRIAALTTLGQEPASAAIQHAIARQLRDPELAVRQAAVRALLHQRQDLAAVEARLHEIVEPPAESAWDSAIGVGGRALGRNLGRLAADLEHSDPSRRAAAVQRLCNSGPAGRDHQDAILALVADPAVEVRLAVVTHLPRLDWNEPIRTTLVLALKDQEATVRAQAARSLGAGHDEPDVVAALRTVIQDPDDTVRAAAIAGIGRCRKHAAPANGDLVASLRDRAAKVRVAALGAVAHLGLFDERALAGIQRCLRDTDDEVLAEALRTVTRARDAARSEWPRVLELTRHAAATVRQPALAASLMVAAEDQWGATALRLVEALLDEAPPVQAEAHMTLIRFVHHEW